MSYYRLLDLEKEPFSTSPDPAFFYESRARKSVLLRTLINIRLKRGVTLILGDVGTGKTTLSRKLFQTLKARKDIIFSMVLDPTYENERVFLDSLVRTFKINMTVENPTLLDYKESIKEYLFRKGVEEKKTIVFLIDEAQKLNELSLEVLRVLLNYETNEYKMIQLVLLGQLELVPQLKKMQNFTDRISYTHMLQPFAKDEIAEMINFRLARAGFHCRNKLFTDDSIREIYDYTGGSPRRVTLICHEALRTLIMENKTQVTKDVIKNIIAHDVLHTAAFKETR